MKMQMNELKYLIGSIFNGWTWRPFETLKPRKKIKDITKNMRKAHKITISKYNWFKFKENVN